MPYYIEFVNKRCKLGHYYLVNGIPGKFIKVTRKGFNFLDENSNCCLLRKHVYSQKFSHKELPKDISEISIRYPKKIDHYYNLIISNIKEL